MQSQKDEGVLFSIHLTPKASPVARIPIRWCSSGVGRTREMMLGQEWRWLPYDQPKKGGSGLWRRTSVDIKRGKPGCANSALDASRKCGSIDLGKGMESDQRQSWKISFQHCVRGMMIWTW